MAIKEREEKLWLARGLRERGIPLDEHELEAMEAACQGLDIIQIDNIVDNIVFELDSGQTGCMLHIGISNNSNRIIRPQECWLKMPWPEPNFHWLEDPLRKEPCEYFYSFPDPGPSGFERDAVLNHRLGYGSRVLPGPGPEGLLLGMGEQPIPERYQHRQRVEMHLVVVDGRGETWESKVKLMVERQAQQRCARREESHHIGRGTLGYRSSARAGK